MNTAHFHDDRIHEVLAGAPLTPEEREFLITDTPNFEECDADVAITLTRLSDAELMRTAYSVWRDYVRTQG